MKERQEINSRDPERTPSPSLPGSHPPTRSTGQRQKRARWPQKDGWGRMNEIRGWRKKGFSSPREGTSSLLANGKVMFCNPAAMGLDFCFCFCFFEASYWFYLLNNKRKSQNIFLILWLEGLIYFDRNRSVPIHQNKSCVWLFQDLPGITARNSWVGGSPGERAKCLSSQRWVIWWSGKTPCLAWANFTEIQGLGRETLL